MTQPQQIACRPGDDSLSLRPERAHNRMPKDSTMQFSRHDRHARFGSGWLGPVFGPLALLPSGHGLKIDQADIGRAGFVRCLPNGCIAEVIMDDELIKKLRSGKTATFIIFQTPEEGIGFPMSLAGFGEGYDKLP